MTAKTSISLNEIKSESGKALIFPIDESPFSNTAVNQVIEEQGIRRITLSRERLAKSLAKRHYSREEKREPLWEALMQYEKDYFLAWAHWIISDLANLVVYVEGG